MQKHKLMVRDKYKEAITITPQMQKRRIVRFQLKKGSFRIGLKRIKRLPDLAGIRIKQALLYMTS